jgi:predicted nucleic acid-binding protein
LRLFTLLDASTLRRTAKPLCGFLSGNDLRDTVIAGIVVARHATLATRNLVHFEDLSVPVVNPWLVSQVSKRPT